MKRILLLFAFLTGLHGQTLINGNRVQIGHYNYCAPAGGTDTYACNLAVCPTNFAYVTGTLYHFTADVANTGAATINYCAEGPITIKKLHDQDLATGNIEAGQTVTLLYDGTNMQMQSQLADPGAGSGDFSSNTATSVDSEIVLFSGTLGKTGKRATGTGLATQTAGVLGALAVTDDTIPVNNGTGPELKTLPDCDDSGGNHLNYDATTNSWTCGTSSSGGFYQTVQDEGISQTQRNILNFAGSGVLCADDTTKTTCTISGTTATFTMLPEYVAAKCQNTTASLGLSTFTSNQPTAACVTGTNSTYGVAEFPDSDGEYALQDRLWLPSDLTGTIDLAIKWRTSATTGDVVWQVQTACVADAETGDPSWNTASTVTDTAKGTTLQWNDATITTVTITGCAADEEMLFRFFRDRTHASDTLGAPPQLISVRFKIRRSI